MEPNVPPGAYKSQPWIVFDTLASSSFSLGSATPAKGQDGPAITAGGEMVFFQSSGRTKARMPWYCNLDQVGTLSYGMEVWQMYVEFKMPSLAPYQSSVGPDGTDVPDIAGPPPTLRLIECILNFGVLELDFGQEEQTVFPLSRFGAGGGLWSNGAAGIVIGQNGDVQSHNVLKLPEPIQMQRTQNLSAKIRISPDVFALIGTDAALGVGGPLGDYYLQETLASEPTIVNRAQPPYAVQLGLVGRRVKLTQYGQIPNAAGI